MFSLLGVTIIGALGLILINIGEKDIKVNFSYDFYKNVKYFKLDGNNVIVITKDGQDDIIYTNKNNSNTERYFNAVQMAYESWLKNNTNTDGSASTIKF